MRPQAKTQEEGPWRVKGAKPQPSRWSVRHNSFSFCFTSQNVPPQRSSKSTRTRRYFNGGGHDGGGEVLVHIESHLAAINCDPACPNRFTSSYKTRLPCSLFAGVLLDYAPYSLAVAHASKAAAPDPYGEGRMVWPMSLRSVEMVDLQVARARPGHRRWLLGSNGCGCTHRKYNSSVGASHK